MSKLIISVSISVQISTKAIKIDTSKDKTNYNVNYEFYFERREWPFNTVWVVKNVRVGGRGLNFVQTLKGGGVEIFFMPHWQFILINIIKRLFSWKTIEFEYI